MPALHLRAWNSYHSSTHSSLSNTENGRILVYSKVDRMDRQDDDTRTYSSTLSIIYLPIFFILLFFSSSFFSKNYFAMYLHDCGMGGIKCDR